MLFNTEVTQDRIDDQVGKIITRSGSEDQVQWFLVSAVDRDTVLALHVRSIQGRWEIESWHPIRIRIKVNGFPLVVHGRQVSEPEARRALGAYAARCRGLLDSAEGELRDLSAVNDALLSYAEQADLPADFDAMLVDLGLRGREVSYDVSITATVSATVTVTAATADEARERADYLDAEEVERGLRYSDTLRVIDHDTVETDPIARTES